MRCLALVLVAALSSSALADDAPPPNPWQAVPVALDLPVPAAPESSDHRALALGALGGMYGGFTLWAYFAWYYGVPDLPEFRVGGDGYFGADTYAGGADKLGHAWANLVLARASSQLLRYGGWKRRPAALIAGGMSALYFAFIEVKDGYYYEMSPGDLIFNTLGAATGALMEASPRFDALFDFRVEYWPSKEYKAIVRGEPEADINTINIAEDYSGETFLLALHLGGIPALAEGKWTSASRFVDVVAGFHTENYKPDPLPESEAIPEQTAYLGLSLNLQGVIDRVLRGGGRTRRRAHTVLYGLTEIGNLPFTSVPLVDASRSP